MQTYRVEFEYVRTVVVYLEAEDAEDIHDFVEEEDWSPLDDAPEVVDEDTTVSEVRDYEVFEEDEYTANYCIYEGELREVEGE